MNQIVVTGALLAIGDILSQRNASQLDLYQTIRMGAFGTLFAGPALVLWYNQLNKFHHLVLRVAADQLLFAPISLAAFFTYNALTTGNNLMHEYPKTLLTGYAIWPIVQSINLSLVPLKYRVFVTGVVSLGWNTYLCGVLGKNKYFAK